VNSDESRADDAIGASYFMSRDPRQLIDPCDLWPLTHD